MLWYRPRGGVVRAARWVQASRLGPLAIRGRTQPHCSRAARECAEPLSPRAVRERAKLLPGAARAQAVRRSGARGPASLTSFFFTILAMTCRLRPPLLSLAFRKVHPLTQSPVWDFRNIPSALLGLSLFSPTPFLLPYSHFPLR